MESKSCWYDENPFLETKVNASVASTRVQKAFSMNFREQKRLNAKVLLISLKWIIFIYQIKIESKFEIKLLDQERLRAGRKINEDIIATKVKFIFWFLYHITRLCHIVYLVYLNLGFPRLGIARLNYYKAWQRRLAQCSGWIDGRNSTSLSNFTNKSKKKDEKMTKYQRKKGKFVYFCNTTH